MFKIEMWSKGNLIGMGFHSSLEDIFAELKKVTKAVGLNMDNFEYRILKVPTRKAEWWEE